MRRVQKRFYYTLSMCCLPHSWWPTGSVCRWRGTLDCEGWYEWRGHRRRWWAGFMFLFKFEVLYSCLCICFVLLFLQNTRCNVGAGLHRCRGKNSGLYSWYFSQDENIVLCWTNLRRNAHIFFTSTHCAMPTSASSKSKAQTTADNASSQLFFSSGFRVSPPRLCQNWA